MFVVDKDGDFTVAMDHSDLQETLNSMVYDYGHAVLDDVTVFRVDTENPVKLEVYISVIDENESDYDESDYDESDYDESDYDESDYDSSEEDEEDEKLD